MSKIFADTLYWVALLNTRDQWNRVSKDKRASLGDVRIVTTESVLIEVLNYYSESGTALRNASVDLAQTILGDAEIELVLHEPNTFPRALALYASRFDKGYSLTDCISMLVMRDQGIREVLTHDSHFEQEGFVILL